MQVELDDILHHQRITPLFQPIVDVVHHQIFGYESLSRGPQHSSLYGAGPLFAAATQHQRLAELEQLCVQKALAAWSTFELEAQLFINLSPNMLLDTQQEQWQLSQLMQRHHLSPHQIVFEISERTPVVQFSALKQSIQHLQAQGFSIALDDMGSGYSGLKLWSELQPDFIKIDRYFIHNIDTNPIKLKFVHSLVTLAQQLECQLVAEGVETYSELQACMDVGVELIQGFFFAQPQAIPLSISQQQLACKIAPNVNHHAPSVEQPPLRQLAQGFR